MENLESFFEVLPYSDSHGTEAFAPFQPARQSWAAYDTLSRDADWIYGNFSNSFSGASENEAESRIAIKAVLFGHYAGEKDGRPIHLFTHS